MWENIPHAREAVNRSTDACRDPVVQRPCGVWSWAAVRLRVMSPQPGLVMAAACRVLRPLVRLLIRHGIAYPTLAAALKPLFLEEAQAELARSGMAATDSALTLLSGVHRRDVRRLTREQPTAGSGAAADALPTTWGPVAELVGRWLTDPDWLDAAGQPRALPRSGAASFDTLAQAVSHDVRPRAMLDELLRLGAAESDGAFVRLTSPGFAPRQGFRELSALFAANLHDHLAAAVANLDDEANFLEQALFVDELTESSVLALQQAAREAWQQALRSTMQVARERFDQDAAQAPPSERRHRLRFGVYLFHAKESTP